MNTKPQSQNVLFVGIDWADQEHVCCLVSSKTGGSLVETLEHEPQAIAEWVAGLTQGSPNIAC